MDLQAWEGQALGLVGETGAGKTTTVLPILNLVPHPPGAIVAGEIWFEGPNLLSLSDRAMQQIRGNQISMVFQNPMTALDPVYSVGYQIIEVLLRHRFLRPWEAREIAKQLLEAVGIPHTRVDDFPHEFSGGMRHRVVTAIALACRPKLLIADEPTTALDVTIQAQVLELMKQLKLEFAGAQILVTHDLGVVSEMCDDVAIIFFGFFLSKS